MSENTLGPRPEESLRGRENAIIAELLPTADQQGTDRWIARHPTVPGATITFTVSTGCWQVTSEDGIESIEAGSSIIGFLARSLGCDEEEAQRRAAQVIQAPPPRPPEPQEESDAPADAGTGVGDFADNRFIRAPSRWMHRVLEAGFPAVAVAVALLHRASPGMQFVAKGTNAGLAKANPRAKITYRQLAQEWGIGKSTASRGAAALEKAGLIQRTGGTGRDDTTYELLFLESYKRKPASEAEKE